MFVNSALRYGNIIGPNDLGSITYTEKNPVYLNLLCIVVHVQLPFHI